MINYDDVTGHEILVRVISRVCDIRLSGCIHHEISSMYQDDVLACSRSGEFPIDQFCHLETQRFYNAKSRAITVTYR